MEQNIIVIRPLSSEPVTYSTSLPSYCHGQAISPTSMPISPVTTTTSSLPTPSFQGSSEDFSSLFFPTLTTPNSSSISLSSPSSYSDSLSSLTFHTFSDKPVSSLSYTLTSSVPNSLPPPIPYIGLHLFTLILDLLVFLWDPFLTYTLLFSPLTPCLYPIMVAPLPEYLLPPLGLSPVVPREGPPVAEPETGSGADPETLLITLSGGKVLGPPPLAALFPYFPPGPILLVTTIAP